MAKKSAIQKNLRRIKLVKKYARKRAELKKGFDFMYSLTALEIVFKI